MSAPRGKDENSTAAASFSPTASSSPSEIRQIPARQRPDAAQVSGSRKSAPEADGLTEEFGDDTVQVHLGSGCWHPGYPLR
jgi:hypothetical protein